MICGHSIATERGPLGGSFLWECRKCRLQYLDPLPDPNRLKRIYEDYYKAWDLSEHGQEVSDMKTSTFRSYLKILKRWIPVPCGRLLDVGCATGEWLSVAQGAGFDVYGVEISPQGVAQCRQRFGEHKILGGDLQPESFDAEFFDVITLFDVLEHIADPMSFLRMLSLFLKPGGFLMLATPNTSSWTRKICGSHWPHYKIEHLYYYNPGCIKRILASFFDVLSIRPAQKTLTLDYIQSIMKSYPSSRSMINAVSAATSLAKRLGVHRLKMNIGEMFAIAKNRRYETTGL